MRYFIHVVTLGALLLGAQAVSAIPRVQGYPSIGSGESTPFTLEPDQRTTALSVTSEAPPGAPTPMSATTESASGAPKKAAVPGKKWVHPTFKGAQGAGWIQVPDKPVVPTTGPAATAPRGSEIVGDHWHWPGDYMTVLHGERWGRAGRLGTWKVPIRKVP